MSAARVGSNTMRGIQEEFSDSERPTLAIFSAEEFARESEERIATRLDERWLALAEEGVVDLERAPALQMARSEVRWTACDEVEVHVILRAEAGASIREMLRGCPHDTSDVVRTIVRLVRRGVLSFAPPPTT